MYQVTSAAELEHGAKVFVLRDPGDVNAPSFRVVREITGEVLFYWGEPSRTYTGELRDLLYLAVLLHEVPDARFEIDPDPSDPKPYAIHYAPGAIHYIREHSAREHLRLRTGHRADDDGNDRLSLSRREKIALGAAGLLAIAIIVGGFVNSAISGRSASSTAGWCWTWSTSDDGEVVVANSIGSSCAGEAGHLIALPQDGGQYTNDASEPAHGAQVCSYESSLASEPGGFRVYVGPGGDPTEAQNFCASLQSEGYQSN